jgi:hypothetical protein
MQQSGSTERLAKYQKSLACGPGSLSVNRLTNFLTADIPVPIISQHEDEPNELPSARRIA